MATNEPIQILKDAAIAAYGGDVAQLASALGISRSAIYQWPDELPPRIADRVFAAFVRQHPDDWVELWPGSVTRTAASHLAPHKESGEARSVRQ